MIGASRCGDKAWLFNFMGEKAFVRFFVERGESIQLVEGGDLFLVGAVTGLRGARPSFSAGSLPSSFPSSLVMLAKAPRPAAAELGSPLAPARLR